MLAEVWPFVRSCRQAGRPVALARVVRRKGSAGRRLGAAMAVSADGDWTGSVAGGCVDGDVLLSAARVLSGGPPDLMCCTLGPETRPPWEAGPCCSGQVSVLVTGLFDENVCAAVDLVLHAAPTEADLPSPLVLLTSLLPPYSTTTDIDPGDEHFLEEVRPQPRLVLVGATDVAVSLASLATTLGFRVVVLDPRPAYALESRLPEAVVIRAWPSAWLGGHPLGADDALVALTHEPRFDDAALVQALRDGCGYVAAIGSRATHEDRLSRLAHIPGHGRIHGPAGLDLGGGSSAQTALSILAEVVAERNGRAGGPLVRATGRVHA